MSKAPTKQELTSSLAHWQNEATRLRWILAEFPPPSGFHFIASPRAYQGFLILVDDDGGVSIYDIVEKPEHERVIIEAELWRLHSEGNARFLPSLAEALSAASRFRAKWRAPAPEKPVCV